MSYIVEDRANEFIDWLMDGARPDLPEIMDRFNITSRKTAKRVVRTARQLGERMDPAMIIPIPEIDDGYRYEITTSAQKAFVSGAIAHRTARGVEKRAEDFDEFASMDPASLTEMQKVLLDQQKDLREIISKAQESLDKNRKAFLKDRRASMKAAAK